MSEIWILNNSTNHDKNNQVAGIIPEAYWWIQKVVNWDEKKFNLWECISVWLHNFDSEWIFFYLLLNIFSLLKVEM